MATFPVFIYVPPQVTVYPNINPILVQMGDDISITLTVNDDSKMMYNTTINGDVDTRYSRHKVLTIKDVRKAYFIVVEKIVDYTDAISTNKGPCCGIKNIKLALQEDGSIVGTVSGLPSDVYSIMPHVMREAPTSKLNKSTQKYRVTSWREDGPITTITAMSIVNDTFEKLPTSAVFKTIPKDMYELHTSGIITRSMQNPLESPDSNIYIRSSDLYGTDGWTVQEILEVLQIKATIPAAFNYHVYQLSVTRGSPIISLLHNLLPIPGLVIEKVEKMLSDERYIAEYYVTVAKGTGNFRGRECKMTGSSQKKMTYSPTIIGQPGEPLYIDASTTSAGTIQDGDITLNLIGGIFSVNKSISTIHGETKV